MPDQPGREATCRCDVEPAAHCPEHDQWVPFGGRKASLPFSCCDHCGCGTAWGVWPERTGHDDTCKEGCND